MKKLVLASLLLLFSGGSAECQHYKPPKGSPEEVLDRYLQMINDGDLLTQTGWRKACPLFVELEPYSPHSKISVTTKFILGLGPMTIKGDHAEADVKWTDDIGSIDEKLQFVPLPKAQLGIEVINVFRLTFSRKRCEISADGKSMRVVEGDPQWRLDGPMTVRPASREAAIRYLERERSKVDDAVIRSNAANTIAILKKL